MINSQFQDQDQINVQVYNEVLKKCYQMNENQFIELKNYYEDQLNQLRSIIEEKTQDATRQRYHYEQIIEEKSKLIQQQQNLIQNLIQNQELPFRETQKHKIETLLENFKHKDKSNNDSRMILTDQELQSMGIEIQIPKQPAQNIQNDLQSAQNFRTLEICFIIDTTESMKINKKFIIQAIRQIYAKLGFDFIIRWGVVTYKDYEEQHQYQCYPCINFVEDINTIIEFIKQQEFCGGNDFAEDLQNGINQALLLNWQSMKKIVIILTDAPCHGNKYHQGVSDRFPENDICKQLDQIIDNDIYLISVGFVNEFNVTKKMYSEFQKYFNLKDYKKFSTYEVQELNKKKVEELVQFIIQELNAIKQEDQNQLENRSIQQINNPSIKFTCQVYNCELDYVKLSQFLDNDFQELQQQFHESYYRFKQFIELHYCERDSQPFYQDSIKKVFKMRYQKNNGQVDLYAITILIDGPFKSKLDAAQFIKSHLIAKALFNQFKVQLGDFQNINFQFSNYILLQEKNLDENDRQEHYWIAQRFYEKDQQQQFNDSEGNITSQEESDQNEIIQSFSFFSYYQSNCKFLICDLKIYKDILLHPRINTHSGQQGKEDVGKNAIYNFLYQFRNFKKQYKYLDYLNIKYN